MYKLKLAIRVDANSKIGGGHLMRCINLACAAEERGHQPYFILSESLKSTTTLLSKLGHPYSCIKNNKRQTTTLKEVKSTPYESWLNLPWEVDAKETQKIIKRLKPDWLIYDNYGLDSRWVTMAISHSLKIKILAIDDLDNRYLGADIILDQTNYSSEKRRHKAVSILKGPKFALLNPDFSKLRLQSLEKRLHLKNENYVNKEKTILVMPGMFDQLGLVPLALEALKEMPEIKIIVVMSAQSESSFHAKMQQKVNPKIKLELDASNVAKLMLESDLCLGAAGMSTWERCCLGLPSITISLAENQKDVLKTLKDFNLAVTLSAEDLQKPYVLIKAIKTLLASPLKMLEISHNSSKLCDGMGSKRVVNCLEASLRDVKISDSKTLFNWRNQGFIRNSSINQKRISANDHYDWMCKTQVSLEGIWKIYSEGRKELGHCNAVFRENNNVLWSFYIGEKKSDKGVGGRMLGNFLNYLFFSRNIEKVTAHILEKNSVSIYLHKRFGFKNTGKNHNLLVFELSKCHFQENFNLKITL